jgi:histidyl-tRNA synthetase
VSPKIQAPRGTFDVLGDDALARAALEAQARRILERAGYARIETPTFEATELFARGVGESTDVVQKEMYTLDEGPSESLTLRPEGTAPVCRAYLEHGMHKLPQPVKLWYLSTFYRRERPQAGRYRQFWQVGAEAIGSDDPAVDAELILLLSELLEAVGARGLRLRLSSLGTPATRETYRRDLQDYLREHESELSDEVRVRIDLNPLRAFDADHAGTRRVMAGAPLLLDHLTEEDREHFNGVPERLDAAGVAYEVDPTLVRGLDYYTRTVFEVSSDALGAQSGVGGGGRYDGLMEIIGGPPTPGMGWAAGVERILLSSPPPPVAQPPLDLYVAYAGPEYSLGAFRLAADARRAGYTARLELGRRSLKGQLKQADRAGARFVAILGEEGTSLKDMESGEQKTVEPDTVMHHIRGGKAL